MTSPGATGCSVQKKRLGQRRPFAIVQRACLDDRVALEPQRRRLGLGFKLKMQRQVETDIGTGQADLVHLDSQNVIPLGEQLYRHVHRVKSVPVIGRRVGRGAKRHGAAPKIFPAHLDAVEVNNRAVVPLQLEPRGNEAVGFCHGK
jgi:hypothetical protein